jgi:hypothetical protein
MGVVPRLDLRVIVVGLTAFLSANWSSLLSHSTSNHHLYALQKGQSRNEGEMGPRCEKGEWRGRTDRRESSELV